MWKRRGSKKNWMILGSSSTLLSWPERPKEQPSCNVKLSDKKTLVFSACWRKLVNSLSLGSSPRIVVLEWGTWTRCQKLTELNASVTTLRRKKRRRVSKRMRRSKIGFLKRPTRPHMISETNALRTFPNPSWTLCCTIWTKFGELERQNRSPELSLIPTESLNTFAALSLSRSPMLKSCMSRKSRDLRKSLLIANKHLEKTLLWLSRSEMAPMSDFPSLIRLSGTLTRFKSSEES